MFLIIGDYGGPLVIQQDDKQFVLVGIASYSLGCAETNSLGVFTRVSDYLDWIDNTIDSGSLAVLAPSTHDSGTERTRFKCAPCLLVLVYFSIFL